MSHQGMCFQMQHFTAVCAQCMWHTLHCVEIIIFKFYNKMHTEQVILSPKAEPEMHVNMLTYK